MTVSIITVNDTATTILSGSQTIDSLVKFSTPVKICGGSTSGFTFANGWPVDYSTPMIVPANVALSAIANAGETGTAFVTDFGV